LHRQHHFHANILGSLFGRDGAHRAGGEMSDGDNSGRARR
jgi:hypothetical protein